MKKIFWCQLALCVLVLSACGQDNGTNLPPIPSRTRMPTLAAPGPACAYIYWGPLHNDKVTCVEIVYDHVTAPEAAPELSGLVFDPDGTLYVARTALGEIWAMRDANGDQFMDEPYLIAGGLRLPTALAFYDGALYVLSPDSVTRLERSANGAFDQRTVLIDDFASDTGFWPGSIGIGSDGRLYVSLGASCDLCEGVDDIRSGQIVSYALDGTDRRVEAVGLRDPADFVWSPAGDLWVVDSGRVSPAVSVDGPPDELNRVTPGADFGFPVCADGEDCEPPSVTFAHQSTPGGIAFYTYNGFPDWQGDLVVVLRGSRTLPEPNGYALIVVGFEGDAPDGRISRIVPDARPTSIYAPYSLAKHALSGHSFFPYHPADVAVDGQGWIYVSVSEGRIFRFRPRPADSE